MWESVLSYEKHKGGSGLQCTKFCDNIHLSLLAQVPFCLDEDEKVNWRFLGTEQSTLTASSRHLLYIPANLVLFHSLTTRMIDGFRELLKKWKQLVEEITLILFYKWSRKCQVSSRKFHFFFTKCKILCKVSFSLGGFSNRSFIDQLRTSPCDLEIMALERPRGSNSSSQLV